MIEIRQLQYFLAVAEQLNFSKAAKMLYVTQPLLSQQIAELEKQLNVQLFTRSRRSVSLTPAGNALMEEAQIIVQRVNNLGAYIQRVSGEHELEITLQLGFEQLFERTRLTQGILQFNKNNKNIHCSMKCYSYGKLVQGLYDGTLDIGFSILPNRALDAELMIRHLWFDRLVIVLPKKMYENLTLSDFQIIAEKLPLLLISADPRGMNNVIELCRDIQISPQFQLFHDVHEVLMNVEGGGGFSMLPESLIDTYNSPYLSTISLEAFPNSHLELVACYRNTNKNPVVEAFLEQLSQDEIKHS